MQESYKTVVTKKRMLHKQDGFTLVELMIALSIISTILVMSTVLLMQIGRLYTKGVNQANLQNATRNVVNDISSAIQFSGSTPVTCGGSCNATYNSVPVSSICIHRVRYTFVLHRELGVDSAANSVAGTSAGVNTPHVLWRDTMASEGSCPVLNITSSGLNGSGFPTNSSSDGYEMVPQHVRLTNFSLAENPSGSGVYEIKAWMAYGDSDLVIENSGKPSCSGDRGTQFCAISILTTSAAKRIQ